MSGNELNVSVKPIERLGASREGCVGEMTANRAIYFLERFKGDEKMLGPHEQWALDFAISTLSPQPVSGNELNVSVKPENAVVTEAMLKAANAAAAKAWHTGENMTLAILEAGISASSALSPQPVTSEPVAWHIPGSIAVTKDRDITDRWRFGNPNSEILPLYASPQPVTKPAMGEGWMPIETAPKDGARFLTFHDRLDGDFNVAMAWWSGDRLEGHGWSYASWNMPTHWMPLPAPPATGGEEL
jgi:hypothetical protein